MPMHVFIDLFHDEELRKGATMLICKSKECLDFLDDSWDAHDFDGILCKVDKKSVVCKCMIDSQNFIASFFYIRWHQVNGHLIAIDQDLHDELTTPLTMLEVHKDLENEVDLNLPPKFLFQCNMRKVPQRKEKEMKVCSFRGRFANNVLPIIPIKDHHYVRLNDIMELFDLREDYYLAIVAQNLQEDSIIIDPTDDKYSIMDSHVSAGEYVEPIEAPQWFPK
ncbi:hypothetical protein L7F22_031949, partial [Adiantum nelumboides]|nr:hypothetical protein [Adiantum nelumboides]